MDVIFVNGAAIPDGAIAAEMQCHSAPNQESAWREDATALVVRALLLREAGRLGITAETDDEEAAIRTLLSQEVQTPEPDEAACRRYFAANRARFRATDVYEAAHILFPADPGDAAARAKAKQAAETVLVRLRDTPGRFETLAREHSACPSAANGGRLGQQSRGDLVPEIETFVMALDDGQISPVPVASRYGYHVLRRDRCARGEDLPYEAVAETLALQLATMSWQRAVSQYLRVLAGRARIEGFTIDAASSLLVQ